MKSPSEILENYTLTYLHAADYNPAGLRSLLQRRPDSPAAKGFAEGLQHAIDTGSITPQFFENITDIRLDTPEELTSYLTGLRDYLFNNGPEPEL